MVDLGPFTRRARRSSWTPPAQPPRAAAPSAPSRAGRAVRAVLTSRPCRPSSPFSPSLPSFILAVLAVAARARRPCVLADLAVRARFRACCALQRLARRLVLVHFDPPSISALATRGSSRHRATAAPSAPSRSSIEPSGPFAASHAARHELLDSACQRRRSRTAPGTTSWSCTCWCPLRARRAERGRAGGRATAAGGRAAYCSTCRPSSGCTPSSPRPRSERGRKRSS